MKRLSHAIFVVLMLCAANAVAGWRINNPTGDIQPLGPAAGGGAGNGNASNGNAAYATYAATAGSAGVLTAASYCNPSASGYCYMFADTTHITLNANGLAALSIDGNQNSVFGGNITLPSTSMVAWLARTQMLAPADGTLQLLTSTGTFGKLLLGAAGATTGVQFVASSGQLRIQDGVGANAIQMLVNQVNSTYFNVGGGALTFNGSGAAVGAIAASIYTPNTTTLRLALGATDILTLTSGTSTFSNIVQSTFFQATGGQGAFQSANTTATFANNGNTGAYVVGNALTLKTNNVAAVSIDANQNTVLAGSATVPNASGYRFAAGQGLTLDTAIATGFGTYSGLRYTFASNNEVFAWGGAAQSGAFQMQLIGSQLSIFNGSGNRLGLNVGSINMGSGVITSTAVNLPAYVGPTGYGVGFPDTTHTALYTNNTVVLSADNTQNVVFNNGAVSGSRFNTSSKAFSTGTPSYTIAATESGVHFDNTGATSTGTFNLPSPVTYPGFNNCFTTTAAQTINVTTPAGAILGSTYTSGATRQVQAQLTTFCVEAKNGNYYISQLVGTIFS